jgi:hypothetical protein
MPGTRRTWTAKLASDLGCVLWPIGVGLVLVWAAGRFSGLNFFHLAAIVAFGIALLGFRLAVYERLRKCPHGVRGAIASPPLCAACLAEKKAREHGDRVERKSRGRERAEARGPERENG